MFNKIREWERAVFEYARLFKESILTIHSLIISSSVMFLNIAYWRILPDLHLCHQLLLWLSLYVWFLLGHLHFNNLPQKLNIPNPNSWTFPLSLQVIHSSLSQLKDDSILSVQTKKVTPFLPHSMSNPLINTVSSVFELYPGFNHFFALTLLLSWPKHLWSLI